VGVKDDRCVWLITNLTTFMNRLSRNPGSLNLLEPSGPVQTSIGIVLRYLFSNIISLLKLNGVCVAPTTQVRTFAILLQFAAIHPTWPSDKTLVFLFFTEGNLKCNLCISATIQIANSEYHLSILISGQR